MNGPLEGFEKFTPKKRRSNKPISNLKIGEAWFFPEKKGPKLYNRFYAHGRRYGKVFSIMEIKNGVVIRRDK